MDGTTLTQRRTAAGLSMQQLADEAGISHVTVWRIERNVVTPTNVVVRAIDAALLRAETAAIAPAERAS